MPMSPNDAPPASPRAAIIIPHYNDVRRLELCLESLAAQVAAVGDVEVVVADNGSTQDLGPLQAAHPWARFLHEPEKGAAPARNTGVRATMAPRLFFIDADCIAAPDWLARALAETADGVVGGRVDLFDETPPPRSGAEAFETVFGFPQQDYVERKKFSVTANLLTTRAVFEDVGPFDGRMAEDLDWCHRAVQKGWPIVYRPDLAVSHPTRSDWPALCRKWQRITTEGYFVNGTGIMDRARWALRALAVLASGPVHLHRVLRHSDLRGEERGPAISTLLRLRVLRAVWMTRQALFGARPRDG